MTDPNEKAREIADKIVRGAGWADKYVSTIDDGLNWDVLVNKFAAALREADAEFNISHYAKTSPW